MSFAFNTQGVPQRDNNYGLLPSGWYLMQAVESDIKTAASGNGQYLKVVFEVLQQGFNGRKLFSQFNVRHTNPQAERIGQQELRELCEAAGLPNGFQDSVQLHGRPFLGRVKTIPAKGQYEAKNEVKAFKAAGSNPQQAGGGTPWAGQQQGGTPPAPAQQAQSGTAPAAGNGGKAAPPWQR